MCCILAAVDAFAGTGQDDRMPQARAELLQAVEEARNGEMAKLYSIVESMRGKDSPFAEDEFQADYLSLLKDGNGYVQFCAVQCLIWFQNAATRDALCEYLKTRDFAKLKAVTRGRPAATKEARQSVFECMAVSHAVLALGEIGDESVVPLLNGLRDDVTWDAEWVGRPVEHAMAKLGAIRVLASTSLGAEQRQIEAAAGAIASIRDPNRVPELMAVARDAKVQQRFRLAALSALGRFNSPGVSDLLVTIMNDPNAHMDLRSRAALSAGGTGDRTVEASLLIYANDAKSPIRANAFVGLVLCMPDKYLGAWFNTIMDPNEDLKFRQMLVSREQHIPRALLQGRKEDLYRCLQAADRNGRPIDDIRVTIWGIVNSLFHEEPPLVLTSKARSVLGHITGPIERRVMRENPRLSVREQYARVDEEIDKLVTVYARDADETRRNNR